MAIHKEGYKILIFSFLIVIGIIIGADLLFPQQTWYHYILYLALTITFMIIVRFFRDPQRNSDKDDSVILAPADGKIVVIEEVQENEYFKDKRIQVSIFMSPFNVHINWFPIAGVVKYSRYHPGQHMIAFHPKSSQLNERTSVVVENHKGQALMVKQIAGGMARRIVCYAKVGDPVHQNEELGFIKFGSRVDLLLPKNAKIMVDMHQKVKGTQTVIARLHT
jgi:phosphatidylserine decarboxylase